MSEIDYERPSLLVEAPPLAPRKPKLSRRQVNQNTVETSTPEGTPFDKLQIISRTQGRRTDMFVCLLAGRGCKRNQHRHKSVPCESCVPAGAGETIGALIARLSPPDTSDIPEQGPEFFAKAKLVSP